MGYFYDMITIVQPFKVIIAGGRDFTDFQLLKRSCDNLLINKPKVEIVSGGAAGSDALGEDYAYHHGFPCEQFEADWNLHGKSAGPIRNRQMAEYADALIAFWDGKSQGTRHMIQMAQTHDLDIRIINY
jgi:hypothetical protein